MQSSAIAALTLLALDVAGHNAGAAWIVGQLACGIGGVGTLTKPVAPH
jgi:hypothetical protein